MKIIFLDIDGVLLPTKWLHSNKSSRQFKQSCVKNLNYILEKTEAKIVVSSTWRKWFDHLNEENTKILEFAFSVGGIKKGSVIDTTKSFSNRREYEINEWLLGHKKEVENFVIIDDSSDVGHSEVHIKPDHDIGLTKAHAQKCVKLLNSKQKNKNETPICSFCFSKMTERTRHVDGHKFYGCLNYPRCKFTIDLFFKENQNLSTGFVRTYVGGKEAKYKPRFKSFGDWSEDFALFHE